MSESSSILRAAIGETAELAKLAKQIKKAHDAGESARLKGLEHYHQAGQSLLKAKALVRHGQWGAWLKNLPGVTERRAERYMKLAKFDVTSDLEHQWRQICGNECKTEGQDKTARKKPHAPALKLAETDEPEASGVHQVPLFFSKDELDQFKHQVDFLEGRFGTDSLSATVLAAVAFAYEHKRQEEYERDHRGEQVEELAGV